MKKTILICLAILVLFPAIAKADVAPFEIVNGKIKYLPKPTPPNLYDDDNSRRLETEEPTLLQWAKENWHFVVPGFAIVIITIIALVLRGKNKVSE
ncbi:MAG: hypothetical protein ABIB97_04070 [Patescibacteria group bacterium]